MSARHKISLPGFALAGLIFFCLSFSCFAATSPQWYESQSLALAACQSTIGSTWQSGSQTRTVAKCMSYGSGLDLSAGSGICGGNNSFIVYQSFDSSGYYSYSPTKGFAGCYQGFDSCPHPGETRDTAGSCVCPSGQELINGACSVPLTQDCPADSYRTGPNTCSHIPDCNADKPDGGSYFDVASGACVTPPWSPDDPYSNACRDPNKKYCPVLPDCIAASEICTNNQANKDSKDASQPQRNSDAKNSANNSAQTADNAKNDAQAAANARNADAQAKQDAATAANSNANNNPTPTNYQSASNASAEAATAAQRAANSAAAAIQAANAASAAAAARDSITTSTPGGVSENRAADAADAASSAQGYAGHAVNGTSSGGAGNGSGDDEMGNCPGCAKESTLQALIQGDANNKGQGGSGAFDLAAASDAVSQAKTAYQTKFNDVKTQFNNLISVDLNSTSELPSFDFGTIKGVDVVIDLNKWSTQLDYIGLIILFAAAIISAMIILG